jgi:hypothetical protein
MQSMIFMAGSLSYDFYHMKYSKNTDHSLVIMEDKQ